VRVSPHDNGTVQFIRTGLVVHCVEGTTLQMCGIAFRAILIRDVHFARNKGSSDRSAVKWRKVGEKKLSEWLFHVVKTLLSCVYFLDKKV
jgi:hypothetical protein